MRLRFRQIHLDFHTSEHIAEVAAHFNAAEFAATMKAAAVDSVTVFSRCHHGMIYHPTRFTDAHHPGLKRNLLGEQIEALHKVGIRAPIYISVGYDEHMARKHPEYIEINPEGKRMGAGPLQAGWRKLCLNSPYVDYVMEQTEEVLQMWPDADGFFFDIISQRGCCCRYCLEGMQREGMDPENPADRQRFSQLVLDRYRERHTTLVRKYNSDCTIFFNSGHIGPDIRPSLHTFTHLELESLPTGGWGYDHFPLTVRYARNLNLPYLGMTGKFQKSWADFGGFKPLPALEYDCFVALAHGARCSVGDQLHPSGVLDQATYDLISPVYHSVAAKEPWCDNATAVTEIAVVTPEATRTNDGRVDHAVRGALRLLQEAHYQFDVVDFAMPWHRYKLVILPDKITLTAEEAEKVRAYLAAGGKVIASYRSGLSRSENRFVVPELGVTYVGDLPYHPDYLVADAFLAPQVRPTEHVMYERGLQVKADAGTQVVAAIWEPYFNRTWEHFTSHRHAPAHKKSDDPGAVATEACVYFAHPVFTTYAKHGPEAVRQMLLNAVAHFVPEPVLQTDAPGTAHISVMQQSAPARTVVHVLHYIPERRYSEIDLIVDRIPLYNVGLKLRTGQAPRRVYLAPEGQDLSFSYDAGVTSVTVPKVDGHAMVVVE